MCSTVQTPALCLFPTSSNHCFDVSGILIHDNNRSLRLRRKFYTFIYSIAFGGDCGDIFFHFCIRLLLCRLCQTIFVTGCIIEIITHCIVVVIILCTIRMSNSDCTTDSPFNIGWVIAVIAEFFLTNLLHFRILCGDNAKSATVYGVVSLCLSITHLIDKIFNHLICHSIYKIRTDRTIVFILGVSCLDTLIHWIGNRIIILSLINITLFFHITENLFSTFCIFIRVCHGIIFSWILCDCGNRCRF